MEKRLIRLCYQKIIDASSPKNWDKFVFEDTFREFYMQAQFYNQENKYATFQDLLDHVPNADRLHGLVSTAAIGYIRQLNGIIPEVMNVHQKMCLPFQQFKFEIIQSHIEKKELHKIAIYFYSDPLTWIDTIGNRLFIAYGNQKDALQEGKEVLTDVIELQPNLNIYNVLALF